MNWSPFRTPKRIMNNEIVTIYICLLSQEEDLDIRIFKLNSSLTSLKNIIVKASPMAIKSA